MGTGAREMWAAVVDRYGGDARAGPARHVGEVVQVYDRSAYLELELGSGTDVLGPPLVLLCGEGFDGPLSTRIVRDSGVPCRELGVAVGDSCRLRAATGTARDANPVVLSVGGTLEMPLRPEALDTVESTVPYGDIRSIDRDSEAWARGAELASWLGSRDEEDGLGWAPDLLAAVDEGSPTGDLTSLGERWAAPLAGTGAVPEEPGVGVLGRGPGTTPSGDDILAGILVALHLTTCGQRRETVRRLGEATVRTATERTTRVSTALLAQAAQGRPSGRADALLRALLEPSSKRQCETAASELVEVGHTSGADLLVGMLIAVLLICPAVE